MFAWFLFAAIAGMPQPAKAEPKGSPSNWVRAEDLPRIDGEAAITTFDLTIDQTGRAAGCTIIVASGSDRLDAAICAALTKRARFRPARNIDGETVAAVYRDRVVWLPQGSGSNRWYKSPDIVISTPMISKELRDIVEVVVVVSETGAIGNCYVVDGVDDAGLNEMACSSAKNPAVSLPVIDAQGARIEGIRSFYVGFQPGAATQVEIR